MGDAQNRPMGDAKNPANRIGAPEILEGLVAPAITASLLKLGTLSPNPWDFTLYGQKGLWLSSLRSYASGPAHNSVSNAFPLAGFEVSLIGRITVSPEAMRPRASKIEVWWESLSHSLLFIKVPPKPVFRQRLSVGL